MADGAAAKVIAPVLIPDDRYYYPLLARAVVKLVLRGSLLCCPQAPRLSGCTLGETSTNRVHIAPAAPRRHQFVCTRQLPPTARRLEHNRSASFRVLAARRTRYQEALRPADVRKISGSCAPSTDP
jgi:hypothetical protein